MDGELEGDGAYTCTAHSINSTFTVRAPRDGVATLAVHGIDAAGNAGRDVTLTWMLDTRPPRTAVAASLASISPTTFAPGLDLQALTAPFAVVDLNPVQDVDTVAYAVHVGASLSGLDASAPLLPLLLPAPPGTLCVNVTGLPEGSVSLHFAAVDAAGNVDPIGAVLSVYVLPRVGVAFSVPPPRVSASAEVSLAVSLASLDVRAVGGVWVTAVCNGTTVLDGRAEVQRDGAGAVLPSQVLVLRGLLDGVCGVSAYGVDAVGRLGDVAVASMIVDTVPPTSWFVAPLPRYVCVCCCLGVLTHAACVVRALGRL
jgi:hypothetical protein